MTHFIAQLFTRPTRIIALLGLLAIALFGRNAVLAHTSTGSDQQIGAAVTTFLRTNESPLADHVNVEVTQQAGDYARLTLTPDGVEGDTATAYVHRENGGWTIVGIGTGFAPEDCAALNIPAGLGCGE